MRVLAPRAAWRAGLVPWRHLVAAFATWYLGYVTYIEQLASDRDDMLVHRPRKPASCLRMLGPQGGPEVGRRSQVYPRLLKRFDHVRNELKSAEIR